MSKSVLRCNINMSDSDSGCELDLQKSIFDEEMLTIIASRLGYDWSGLGCYLTLKDGDLMALHESVVIPVCQKPLRMFKRWREMRTNTIPEKEEIQTALIKSRRRDMSEFVKRNSEGADKISDSILKELSDHLVKEWYTLGVYLGIPFAELDVIDQSTVAKCNKPGITLLKKWKDFMSPHGELLAEQEILNALKIIKRFDLVSFIESTLNL